MTIICKQLFKCLVPLLMYHWPDKTYDTKSNACANANGTGVQTRLVCFTCTKLSFNLTNKHCEKSSLPYNQPLFSPHDTSLNSTLHGMNA